MLHVYITISKDWNFILIIAGERGLTVLSTKPRILFCDLKLAAGESKSCMLIRGVEVKPGTGVIVRVQSV